ncbi:ABC transporter [Salmonella enterica subsp. arizonae]|uniref:ABC transporter n=1 Tax=Salmonella enterica subsp. arizonae TaxID=59203 RepID=A0A379SZZ7_SALER|nr:ABC transporter [Salmonella enterica subsp. arizonae]
MSIKNVTKPTNCLFHLDLVWATKSLKVSNLRKSYGDRVLIDDLSFSVPKGAIVGIIGPNGAGKSTLFRMMSGQEQPDSGTITLGETVKLASVDQFRDAMDNSKTVWEEVSGGLDIMKIGNTEMPSRAYVGRFNFKGVDQGKRVGELSGGERGRLHLAKLLQVGGNVLLLDETDKRPGYRNPARAGKRPAGVPGLRDGYLARPLVP